jgi:anti-sigma factor RsiW
MVRSASSAISADRLADYMMGRLQPGERACLRALLAVDPSLRGALRRLRRMARALRERCGESGGGEVPPAWLVLVGAIARDAPRSPMSPYELARERKLTWL